MQCYLGKKFFAFIGVLVYFCIFNRTKFIFICKLNRKIKSEKSVAAYIFHLLKILAFVATITAKNNYHGTNIRNERIDF